MSSKGGAFFRLFLYFVPVLGRPSGALVSFLVQIRRPRFLVQWVLRSFFVKRLRVDTSELEKPVAQYGSVLEFFTRRLKAGARTVDASPRALVSPADGLVSAFGRIERGTLLQAKGMPYQVRELLEGDEAPWQGGQYLVIYLSPRDYHRVHHPADATLASVRPLPGRLYPVNDGSVSRIPRVFARNRRTVFDLRRKTSRVALVMVTAFNVGRVAVAPRRSATSTKRPAGLAHRGDELATFELGSTVVLLLPKGAVRWVGVKPGMVLRMGRKLGVFTGL